jgi:hypothetical protein
MDRKVADGHNAPMTAHMANENCSNLAHQEGVVDPTAVHCSPILPLQEPPLCSGMQDNQLKDCHYQAPLQLRGSQYKQKLLSLSSE